MCLWAYGSAHAETSKTFRVTAQIEKSCKVNSVEQTLDFGSKSALATDTATASLTNSAHTWNILCSVGLPVSVSVDGGQYLQAPQRRMKHVQHDAYVSYQLYADAAYAQEYLAGQTHALTTVNTTQTLLPFAVYGRAHINHATSNLPAGMYQDRVGITFIW